jgi:hypothetical protein
LCDNDNEPKVKIALAIEEYIASIQKVNDLDTTKCGQTTVKG